MSRSYHTEFEVYSRKYANIRLRREDGILELALHSDGESLKWGGRVHEELTYCFSDLAADPGNGIIIITGTGSVFCQEVDADSFGEVTAGRQILLHQEGRRLLEALLDLPVPVIGALNGPAFIHAELALLANMVVASEDSLIQDLHFDYGIVPGDGVHVVWPELLGPTRGSYFLLMGQRLDAAEALRLGIVNEVVPLSGVLPRAWEMARHLMARPAAVRRYARHLLADPMRRRLRAQLSHGLALECLAVLDDRRDYDSLLAPS